MATSPFLSKGHMVDVAGDQIFVLDQPPASESDAPPLVVIHGFPTSSIDWSEVVAPLAERRRVILFDLPGYGFSSKPDRAYSISSAADAADGVIKHLGLTNIDMITHDMGDTVGGELLARQLEGGLDVDFRKRVVTNGSIYLAMAKLTDGQKLLWEGPDEALPEELTPTADMLAMSLTATLAPPGGEESQPDPAHVQASADAIALNGGNRLLPRLIRYLSDRRDNEARYTGAIENHPSDLGIVWGSLDPIAVVEMARQLRQHRNSTDLGEATLVELEGVGHYPMAEAPEAFAKAVVSCLDG